MFYLIYKAHIKLIVVLYPSRKEVGLDLFFPPQLISSMKVNKPYKPAYLLRVLSKYIFSLLM